MKKLNIYTILAVFTLASFSDRYIDEPKKKILVVSFIEEHFYSDIYSKEEIAKKNKIQEEDVISLYNEKLSQIFSNFSDEEIEYVACPAELTAAFKEMIKMENRPTKAGSDVIFANLSDVSQTVFSEYVNSCNTDYVLFVNTYRMAWVGEPQYKLENHIHYSIYKKNKQEVISDKAVFSTPNLIPVVKMEKKYLKAVNKISRQFSELDS